MGNWFAEDQARRDKAWHSAMQLERGVVAVFRTLGARVEREAGLAGSQIDLLVSEEDPSGWIRTAVECKAYSRPVGVSTVRAFGGLVTLLRERDLIDKAMVVSRSGFTKQAREAIKSQTGIQLHDYAELLQRVHGREDEFRQNLDREPEEPGLAPEKGVGHPKRKIFVVMPFGREFDDVYVLGIREIAEKLGVLVERADEVQHNGDVLGLIQKKIREADAVVGDTSGNNPNVFYEIGYAHASDRPTILITRKGTALAFDLQSINHIFFDTIVELRAELEPRLKYTLDL